MLFAIVLASNSPPAVLELDRPLFHDTLSTTMSLLLLSNELITAIAEIVHPSSVVNFALTSHHLYNCASDCLALHRSRQLALRAQHDRHPMTIINLLHMAYTSPDLLWYVRVLEFYGGRSSWESWKTYYDYRRVRNEPRVNFTSSGTQLLSDVDIEIISQKYGFEQFMQEIMERVKKGDDEPLKTILIASCPRLEKVTWVSHVPDAGSQPFSILCDLASAHRPLPHTLWPPGLLSLRSISLGACTEYVHPHDNLHPDLADFCRLLLLPNLKSLRINVAGYGDSDLEYLNTHVPARSSSVEDITLYICDFRHSAIVAILERLGSLRRYRDIYLGPWINILADIQPWFGDTLEELRTEGDNDWNLRLYSHVSTLSCFPKLRVFNIYVGDLIAEDITSDITGELVPATVEGKKVQWHDFHAVLPQAAEDIIFGWPRRNRYHQLEKYKLHKTLFPDFFEHLDKFVRRRGKRNGGCLKMICLSFVEREGLVQHFGETEADEFHRLVDEWSGLWGEAGVQVVIPVSGRGHHDEVLECLPTAPGSASDAEVDSDSDVGDT
jgi:hypothetical protein